MLIQQAKGTFMLSIPIDVPETHRSQYYTRLHTITKGTGRLALFSADHKVEHLDHVAPETLLYIAQEGYMPAFATHLGIVSRYAAYYTGINYIIKLNGKSNLRDTTYDDPYSSALFSLEQVARVHDQSNASICGIGYTVYLGSSYEQHMLSEAAELVHAAHQCGYIAIIWMYPRGIAIHNEQHPDLITGAAGVATSLGSDFVKVKVPQQEATESAQHLAATVRSAGSTGVLCSGGSREDAKTFLDTLYQQIHTGHVAGCAVGRNIFRREPRSAIAMTRAITAIVYEGADKDDAYAHLYKHT